MKPVSRGEAVLLAGVLAALAAALAWEAWTTGITVDEPSHLLSARLYWQHADRLKPGDLPPLLKIAAGWVPAMLDIPMAEDRKDLWQAGWEMPIANEIVAKMTAERARRVFFLSRLPALVFPLAAALLLWWWARQLFGPVPALLIAVAFAAEPTALGHGALLKNDLAAAFGFLLFWYRAWRYWREPCVRTAAWLGLALLVAILAKMSMLVLLAAAPAIVLARVVGRAPRPARDARALPAPAVGPSPGACPISLDPGSVSPRRCGSRSVEEDRAASETEPRFPSEAPQAGRFKRCLWGLAHLAIVLLIAWSGAVAAWQFDARRLSAADLRHPALPVPVRAVSQVFRVLPVPRAAWESAVFLLVNNAGSSPVYLLGKRYDRGHWAYFLVGAAVKSPAACQALVLAGLAALLSRYRRRLVLSDVFWIAPGPLYFILASMSSLQFGFRLVLPALPFALLPAGTALVSWPALTRFPALIGVLLAAPSASIYPHGISYFNFCAGGPEKGLKYLADSNLDWGQDLPRVAEIASAHRIPRIRLCYFGSASPFRVLREGEVEVIPPPWSPDLARGTELRPEPGWYAISATLLPGYFFDAPYVDYYRAFRDRRPVARAGYSIYIYKVE